MIGSGGRLPEWQNRFPQGCHADGRAYHWELVMERPPLETLEGQGHATVRQISVFVDNRPGQLLRLTQLISQQDIRILALSVVDAADCAIVRLLVDQPDAALESLSQAGWAASVVELVVVALPHGKRGLLTVWSALLAGEINIAYAYPLFPAHIGPAIALHVDNVEIAISILREKAFHVLSEADLQDRS